MRRPPRQLEYLVSFLIAHPYAWAAVWCLIVQATVVTRVFWNQQVKVYLAYAHAYLQTSAAGKPLSCAD